MIISSSYRNTLFDVNDVDFQSLEYGLTSTLNINVMSGLHFQSYWATHLHFSNTHISHAKNVLDCECFKTEAKTNH